MIGSLNIIQKPKYVLYEIIHRCDKFIVFILSDSHFIENTINNGSMDIL